MVSDNFLPNLNVILPRSVLDPAQSESPQVQIKLARGQYQQALVRYLRQLDVETSLRQMQQAMLNVIPAFPANQQRAYWWIAAGFFDCMCLQKPTINLSVPKLLGRIDQQMRLSIEGTTIEEQPELNQMLFVIANHASSSPSVSYEVNQTYALQHYLQPNDSTHSELSSIENAVSPDVFNALESYLPSLPYFDKPKESRQEPPVSEPPLSATILPYIEKQSSSEIPEALDVVQIRGVNVSGTLFKKGSEESTQHVATLQKQFAALITTDTPYIDYDFMRAAHILAEINRSMGFTTIVDLAFALENWLNARMDRPFRLKPGQIELLQNTISTLDRMVQDLCSRQYPKASSDMVYLLNMDKGKLHVNPEDEDALTYKPRALKSTVIPLFAASVSELNKQTLANTESSKKDPAKVIHELDKQLLPIFLDEANDLIPRIGESLSLWRKQPDNTQHIRTLNRLLHTLKGSARMTGAMRIGQVAHKMEEIILSSAHQQRQSTYRNELDIEFVRINELLEELRTCEPEELAAATTNVPAPTPTDPATASVKRALQNNMLRVNTDVIDYLISTANEISLSRSHIDDKLRSFKDGLLGLTESMSHLSKQLQEVETQTEIRASIPDEDKPQFNSSKINQFAYLKKQTREMTKCVYDMQTVQHNLLKNLGEVATAISAQAHLSRELQQSLMDVRMVQFKSVADRMYRVVDQTSKELNKRVNLQLSGTTVELDRGVLEKMTVPLEHLLRNAVVHGLENEQQRNKLGKQPVGEIFLELRQENNEVIFELSDDGAGLDFAALREKTIAHGLLLANDAATDEQLCQLIFAAGISTAREVTEIAGRGIGMDIVHDEITALGGRINVSSQSGKGTRFTIHLPLTLAVMRVLTVRCNDTNYAIPAAIVEQVLQIQATDMEDCYRENCVQWQGETYPLYYLPRLLNNSLEAEIATRNSVLLLRNDKSLMALHVDELMDNQKVVVKNIGPQLAQLPSIAGASIRDDGRVMLILNPLRISQSYSASTVS